MTLVLLARAADLVFSFSIIVRNVLNVNPKEWWLLGDGTMSGGCVILGFNSNFFFNFVRET
jgi:hypothetical protein